MLMTECRKIDLESIIENKSIVIHYQPIVSIIKKSVIGLEGLCRGIYAGMSGFVAPTVLFDAAYSSGLSIELDRLCRGKALEGFCGVHSESPELLLFLNIDTSIIDKVVGSNHLINMVNSLCIPTGNVVIEINESRVNDIDSLRRFIDTYRDYGFLIALDDMGSGFSNLDRILLTRPDIIKIDRGLVKDIGMQYHKQEVFKSLVNLSKKIGALVVAEGTETEEEAMLTLELGADMLQGFYFSKPGTLDSFQSTELFRKINYTADEFKHYIVQKTNEEKSHQKGYDAVIDSFLPEICKVSGAGFNEKLVEIVNGCRFCECIYILDESGVQISDTVCRENLIMHKSIIFHPARKGENHSLKKYYYTLMNTGLSRYMTSPYISMATGNLCITVSARFSDMDSRRFILCADFNPEHIENMKQVNSQSAKPIDISAD